MTDFLITQGTQIEILFNDKYIQKINIGNKDKDEDEDEVSNTYITNCTMIACLHSRFTIITGVDKFILTLIMELVQHTQGGELCSSQR